MSETDVSTGKESCAAVVVLFASATTLAASAIYFLGIYAGWW